LADLLPPAENLGLRVLSEAPFLLQGPQSDAVALQVLSVETIDKKPVDLETASPNGDGPRFVETIEMLWAGAMESDGFNRLVLGAGLAWREVAVLRSYAKYLRQAGIAYSQAYIERALTAYPEMARHLVDLFLARLDPALGAATSAERTERVEQIESRIAAALESITTLDEDRILRRFVNALQSTLRTNYWQVDSEGAPKPWISFKVDSRAIDELPAPRPLVEIFVYSPRTEGIHLRGGKVARGGIR